MAKTFKETIASIRAAVLGKEVRECIAQGMEYVEQFASTAVDKAAEAVKAASEALASKNAAASSATAAKTSQTAAASSASAAKTSETNSAASAKNAKDSETKSAEHLQATKDYFEQVRTITIGAQGWYATGDDLKAAVPTGEDGWWAVVGTTDSIWVWDSDTAEWKDSMVTDDLSDYYTRSQVDAKLSAKAESIVLAIDANLNDVTTPGIYSCGGGNSITNKPSGLDAIGLIVIHNATGGYYTQILTTSTNANTYRRTCQNNTWSAWTQDKYTDTTYAAMKGATSSAAGTAGLVPAPAAGAQGKFLRGDGTWQTISSSSKLDAWPVGSIYQSTSSTSPASLFGGTWEEIASERVLMGASSSHAAGSTVDAGLPNIAGTFTALQRYYQQSRPAETIYFAPTGAFNYTEGTHVIKQGDSSALNKNFDYTFDASRSSSVYGKSTTVQPAAYYVYIWHRIA